MENKQQENNQKPHLVLLDGQKANDLESLMKLYTALTGKQPTQAALVECQKILDEAEGK